MGCGRRTNGLRLCLEASVWAGSWTAGGWTCPTRRSWPPLSWPRLSCPRLGCPLQSTAAEPGDSQAGLIRRLRLLNKTRGVLRGGKSTCVTDPRLGFLKRLPCWTIHKAATKMSLYYSILNCARRQEGHGASEGGLGRTS